MALKLYFSNDVETLAQDFSEKIMEAWDNPLSAPVLLVPNRNVEKWLKLYLSKKNNVLIGLFGEFIEKFLWKTLVEKNAAYQNPSLIDGPLLLQALLHCMREIEDCSQCDADIVALRNYLAGNGGVGATARKVGLASRLSSLFLEYEYSRPDLYDNFGNVRYEGVLRKWPQSNYFGKKNPDALAMESWQRILYNKAMGLIKTSLGKNYVTLPGALSGEKSAPNKIAQAATESGLQKPVFVFGVSGMSLFHRQALVGISQAQNVSVFTLNPCSAFWEDVDTTRREMPRLTGKIKKSVSANRLRFDDKKWDTFTNNDWSEKSISELFDAPAETGGPDDNRLLTLWGMAGKENITLWCQAVEYQFEEHYKDGDCDTVLGQVKQSVLHRSNVATHRCKTESGPDASLALLNAPGIKREVESMRDYVLLSLRNDPTLSPADIGVFVTDPLAYRPVLREVLDENNADSPFYIPWLLADEQGKTSLFCKAVTALLSLSEKDFSVSDVFSFLRNPLVANACDVSPHSVAIWESWALQCNVRYGMDAAHKKEIGDIDTDCSHTWQRMFERLLLGFVSQTDIRTNTEIENPFETIRPVSDSTGNNAEQCSACISSIESLYRDVCLLKKVSSWTMASKTLIGILRTWTAFSDDFAEEERVSDRYYEDIALLKIRDSFEGDKAFDFEEFKALAKEHADFELPVKSAYCTGKLTVQAVRPSRAIPFRIVYVMGMNEGSFPGNSDADTLDLRTWNHVPGDLRPYRQAQYAFLELLVCAREKMIISFVGKDLAKDTDLLPCSTVFELQSFVNDAVLEEVEKFEIHDIPLLAEGELSADDNKKRPVWNMPSFSRETAILSHDEAITQKPAKKSNPDESTPQNSVLTFTTVQCAAFLKNPLEFTLKKNLHLYDEENDGPSEAMDAYATNSLIRWKIRQEFCDEVLKMLFGNTGGAIPALPSVPDLQKQWDVLLKSVYDNVIVQGLAPESGFTLFDSSEISRETSVLANAIADVAHEKNALAWECLPCERLETVVNARKRPYYEFVSGNATIRLGSPAHRIVYDPQNPLRREVLCVLLSDKTMNSGGVAKRKALLEPILYCIAQLAINNNAAYSLCCVGYSDKCKKAVCANVPIEMTSNDAKDYMRRLIDDIRDPHRRFDHFPFEIMEELWETGKDFSEENIKTLLEEDADNAFNKIYKINLESLALAEKIVPSDPLGEKICRNRFSVFFSRSKGESGK